MGIAFEDDETEAGGVLGLERGGERGREVRTFSHVDCESVLGIPAMIFRFSTDLLPTRGGMNLLANFPGLPLTMGMEVRTNYRLQRLIPGLLIAK